MHKIELDAVIVRDIREDIREIKTDMKEIFRILNGNGGDGLKVRIDRNTAFRRNASRALWILFAAMVGIIGIIIRMVIIRVC